MRLACCASVNSLSVIVEKLRRRESPYAISSRASGHKKLFLHYLENSRIYFVYICSLPVRVIRKLSTLFLVLCLLAWSVVTPVQAGQQKQGFKATSGKVVLQNSTTPSTSSETMVKKFTDTANHVTTHFYLSETARLSGLSVSSLQGFVYQHPVYNTLSAHAP